MNRTRHARWIDSLEGLSDDPVRRSAQIALAALDVIITSGDLEDDTQAVAAYESLQAALADQPHTERGHHHATASI